MDIDQRRKAMLERSKALWERYEQLKADWAFKHPESTPAAYNQAMREIAERLGL